MSTATNQTADKPRNDSRLGHSVVHFTEDSTAGQDAMRMIYECMYGILTGTIQEERKGA